MLAGLLFGLVPALQTSRPNLNETLKDSGQRGSETGGRNRIGSLLIVSEIALSFILLAGAGLLIKSFMHLREINPGFNPDNVLAMRLTLPPGKYAQGEPRAQIYKQLIDQVKATPGVQSAGAVLSLPLGGDTFNVGRGVIREGRPMTPEEQTNAQHLAITPDYFQTLQIPLKAGRTFTDQDNLQSTKVVIMNETIGAAVVAGRERDRQALHRSGAMKSFRVKSSVSWAIPDNRSTKSRDNKCTCLTRRIRRGAVCRSLCARVVSRLRSQDQCAKRFAQSTKPYRITTSKR